MCTLDRRQLGKGLACGIAAGILRPMTTLAEAAEERIVTVQRDSMPMKGPSWMEVLPGIWKGTVGRAEAITPTLSRKVPPQTESLDRMSRVGQPPIAAPKGSISARGTTLQLPLAAHEQIYGFGLQFFSLSTGARNAFFE